MTDGSRPRTPGLDAAYALANAELQEAKQLEHLNDRLANYVENARYLDAENRRLHAELDALRAKMGAEGTGVKQVYERKLHEQRQQITEYQRDRDTLDNDIARLKQEFGDLVNRYHNSERQLDEKKQTINSMLSQINSLEADNAQLKRLIPELQNEIKRLQNELAHAMNELQAARKALEKRPNYEKQVKELSEEVKFMKVVHEQEVQDLHNALANQPPIQNTDAFKRELADAVQQIRREYERLAAEHRAETDRMNKIKMDEIQQQYMRQEKIMSENLRKLQVEVENLRRLVDELQNENAKLRGQNQQLKAQLDDTVRRYEAELNARQNAILQLQEDMSEMMRELQEIMKAKQRLEAEIALYRKILDVEENHAANTAKEAAKRPKAAVVRPQHVPVEQPQVEHYSKTQKRYYMEERVQSPERFSSDV